MSLEKLRVCKEEEEKYQFGSFSHQDAWELGNELVKACAEMEGPLAVEIEINHVVVFRYFPDGTGKDNELWLRRKRNTVNTTEKSSLRVFYELEASNQSLEKDMLFSPMDYAACGGGFPIRQRGGSQIGVVAVSGLPHLRDYAALMTGIDRYWQKHQA